MEKLCKVYEKLFCFVRGTICRKDLKDVSVVHSVVNSLDCLVVIHLGSISGHLHVHWHGVDINVVCIISTAVGLYTSILN